MTPDLRSALQRCRRRNGWLGVYPDDQRDRYVLVMGYDGPREGRGYRLGWREYLEAFRYWQTLLKPAERKPYTRRKSAA